MHFEPGRKKILFFTRGRGRGHAIPDIAIMRELEQLRPDIQVRFVSYGTGALTLAAHGIPCVDLQLPDQNSIAATTVLAGRVMGALAPDLVVAHEEFSAMPVAKIFGLPTVMITDFFTTPGMLSMESLWYADRVLFLARRGLHAEPPSVRGKVRYLGPTLRKFLYRRGDRRRARAEHLEIDSIRHQPQRAALESELTTDLENARVQNRVRRQPVRAERRLYRLHRTRVQSVVGIEVRLQSHPCGQLEVLRQPQIQAPGPALEEGLRDHERHVDGPGAA